MSVRFALRDGTHDKHQALDARFAALDLSNRADYVHFLKAQAAALLPLEATLDHAGAAQLLDDWPGHRRGAALVADLDALGERIPTPVRVPSFLGPPDILGALYVLEGSRLGGKMLVKQVPDALPTAFLSHRPPLAWRDFVALLEQNLASPVDRAVALRAAEAAFDVFSDAASRIAGNE
ncbi:biliverdin-producing heme oxygenase [Sphingomicrobium sp. XHP0239]|uniref:biliverdin-producing heme oxygenase n=1 Tax=Sphingomicrobium maritimum TaxID=3133972 RepID=UPI0031CCA458